MMKSFLLIMGLLMSLITISSCGSEDGTTELPSEIVPEDTHQEGLKKIYNLFGLNSKDYMEFSGFSGINAKDNAIGLSAVKKNNSKLLFAVYDSILNKAVICDSSFVLPSQLQKTYYDETINYELHGVNSNLLRKENGYVGLASILYNNGGKVTYRYYAYFLNGDKLTCLDSSMMGTTTMASFINWVDEGTMIQYYWTNNNGYRNTLFDMDGNAILTFEDGVSYREYEHIVYSNSDFVQYKFESNYLTIGRKVINGDKAKKKWFHSIKYPDGFDSYKINYTYTKDENILTFNVSGIQKDGSTERFDIKVNIENAKYEVLTK